MTFAIWVMRVCIALSPAALLAALLHGDGWSAVKLAAATFAMIVVLPEMKKRV